MQKNTKPNKRRFSAGESTHCSEREAERIEKPFGAWPSVIGIHHPGGSLRFSTGGQLSLTPGQRIGKARRALAPRGVRGHAPPENFEILWSQGRVFLHFEAADNDFQQPKKITFLDNLIMIK